MRSLLIEVAGVVEAPVDRVAAVVLAIRPGPVEADNGWLFQALAAHATLSGGPDRFRYHANGHSGTIEVDHTRRTIAYQGGWWYRGEYALATVDRGTRVTHRVHNAATRARWGVPLANRFFIGFRGQVRAGFAGALTRLGDEFGCAAYLAA